MGLRHQLQSSLMNFELRYACWCCQIFIFISLLHNLCSQSIFIRYCFKYKLISMKNNHLESKHTLTVKAELSKRRWEAKERNSLWEIIIIIFKSVCFKFDLIDVFENWEKTYIDILFILVQFKANCAPSNCKAVAPCLLNSLPLILQIFALCHREKKRREREDWN